MFYWDLSYDLRYFPLPCRCIDLFFQPFFTLTHSTMHSPSSPPHPWWNEWYRGQDVAIGAYRIFWWPLTVLSLTRPSEALARKTILSLAATQRPDNALRDDSHHDSLSRRDLPNNAEIISLVEGRSWWKKRLTKASETWNKDHPALATNLTAYMTHWEVITVKQE